MSVSEIFCQVGHVDSLGLLRFITSVTYGLSGVRGLALTVGLVSKMMPYFASCVCFGDKPWTVGKSECICGHASGFITI